ncbi:MAG: tyrosine--tRNA ligase [Verrucomicrobiales bacterium]|nr:tyrosine--tRNA ligase [Verrucomicrobiales bacterium]|tara:strand:+ start:5982 stop:7259 length:1278 start_codon:yes stop_codon:yes gene_type:complete
MDIYDELQWRGLVADCTDSEALVKRLSEEPITLYCGFDPTADSLHVGNLVPLLGLRRFQKAGHNPIAVAGGATGSIGDPSGKAAERTLLSPEDIQENIESVKKQLARLLDFEAEKNPAQLVDNADWTANVSYIEFLRDIGKHFSVNMMVAKESVKARMEDREQGISYTEFSYMLLQAFDFYQLCEQSGCELQIGGSDQWGNITAGMDLCRKKLGKHVWGLTLPLITNADGTKFGKTEKGAVWLDPARTSVYRFYQFWIRTDDRDVVRYLKYFTFLPREEIESLEKAHEENAGRREAHQALAKAVTEMIHGKQATADAIQASKILFGAEIAGISESGFSDLADEVPSLSIDRSRLNEGAGLIDLLNDAGLSKSKGEARRDIKGGGVYLNNERQLDQEIVVKADSLLFEKYLLLRKGKKNYSLLIAS